MLALALQLALAAAPAESSVFSLSQDEFVAQARHDLATLKIYATGLRRIQQQLKDNPGVFHHKQAVPYTPEEKRTLLTAWGAFYSYVFSIEGLRQRYWDFLK